MRRIETASGGAIIICTDAEQMPAAMLRGSFTAVFHIEGIEAATADLDLIHVLHAAGLCTLGPVWSRPGIFAGGIFSFIVSFDDYPISMWLADGRHFPIPLFLHTMIERSFDPSIAAMAALMIFFALLLVLVIEKVFRLSLARLIS